MSGTLRIPGIPTEFVFSALIEQLYIDPVGVGCQSGGKTYALSIDCDQSSQAFQLECARVEPGVLYTCTSFACASVLAAVLPVAELHFRVQDKHEGSEIYHGSYKVWNTSLSSPFARHTVELRELRDVSRKGFIVLSISLEPVCNGFLSIARDPVVFLTPGTSLVAKRVFEYLVGATVRSEVKPMSLCAKSESLISRDKSTSAATAIKPKRAVGHTVSHPQKYTVTAHEETESAKLLDSIRSLAVMPDEGHATAEGQATAEGHAVTDGPKIGSGRVRPPVSGPSLKKCMEKHAVEIRKQFTSGRPDHAS